MYLIEAGIVNRRFNHAFWRFQEKRWLYQSGRRPLFKTNDQTTNGRIRLAVIEYMSAIALLMTVVERLPMGWVRSCAFDGEQLVIVGSNCSCLGGLIDYFDVKKQTSYFKG